MTSVIIVGVPESQIPIPNRHGFHFPVSILREIIAETITIDLFGELNNPELITNESTSRKFE